MVIGMMMIRFISIFFTVTDVHQILRSLRRHQLPPPEDTDFFNIGPFDGIGDQEPQPASPPRFPSPPPPPLMRNIHENETGLMGDMAETNAQLTDYLVIPQSLPDGITHYVKIALDLWNPELHLRRIHRLPAFTARDHPFQRIEHGQVIQRSYLLRTPVVRLQGSADRVFSVVMFEIIERDNTLDHFLQFMTVNIHAQNDMPMDIVEQKVVFSLVNPPYPGPKKRRMLVVAYEQRTPFNANDLHRLCMYNSRSMISLSTTFDPREFAITHHLRPAGAFTFEVKRQIMGTWRGRHYFIKGVHSL